MKLLDNFSLYSKIRESIKFKWEKNLEGIVSMNQIDKVLHK
jgi:hypothetical protein